MVYQQAFPTPFNLKVMITSYYKLRDIKTYGSLEWLADNTKKYRSVFEQDELTQNIDQITNLRRKRNQLVTLAGRFVFPIFVF